MTRHELQDDEDCAADAANNFAAHEGVNRGMRWGKGLLLALIAGLALMPSHAGAASRSGREKSRSAKTRSEKSARSSSAKSKKSKRTATASKSERNEFEQRWDAEQVEPELPESE